MQPLSSTTTVFIQRDTRAWQFQAWASFAIAVFLCATGLSWLPGEALDRAFMVMGYVFCLSSAFTLAKTLRDRHEADMAEARLQGRRMARAEAAASAAE